MSSLVNSGVCNSLRIIITCSLIKNLLHMKPNLLFRLSGIILLINGAMAAFMSEMFLEGAGMTLNADGITIAQAFGASLIALGITVLRFPTFVGNLKEALTTAMMAHTTYVVLIGVHLINGQAEGPTPVINIVLNLIFITLYFMARRKA